jgi:gliding motility-associated-like protein
LGNPPLITRNNNIEVRAKQFGTFQNYVVVNNGSNYCKDTVYLNLNLLVRGGDIDFNIPTALCRNEPFLPVNISHSFLSTDSIVEFKWKINNQLYSNEFQPNGYYFQDEGAYQIKLSGRDDNGCIDSLTKQIKVHPEPFLWNIPHTNTICEDQQTRIIAYTSDSTYWKIQPDSILCEHCDTLYQRPHLTSTYFSTAMNEYGCRTKDSSNIIVLNPFQANILNADTSICSGDSMQLTVIPNHKIVNWYPNTLISDIHITNPFVYPKINSYYKVELLDSLNCFISKDSILIKLKQPVWVDAGQDIVLPFQTTYTLMPNYSNNVINYLWSPLHNLSCSYCPNPSIEINKSSTYHIKVTSDSGCVAEDDISIFIECESVNILMPNAFTPNNDGLNDIYKPYNRGIHHYLEFSIYNKMGQKIYGKKNFTINESNVGWDGTFNGKAQNTGTYVYIIQAVCDSGKPIISKGSFLLLR